MRYNQEFYKNLTIGQIVYYVKHFGISKGEITEIRIIKSIDKLIVSISIDYLSNSLDESSFVCNTAVGLCDEMLEDFKKRY